MEVVRVDSKTLCVCMQTIDMGEAASGPGRPGRALHVSVLPLVPGARKRDITIPMNNASNAVLALSRVLFCSLGACLRARAFLILSLTHTHTHTVSLCWG
jgi:hypothetical protein